MPRLRLKSARLLSLLALSSSLSACSFFGFSSGADIDAAPATADSFRLDMPRPTYAVTLETGHSGDLNNPQLPSGFQLKSFVENIFAQRVTPVNKTPAGSEVASIKPAGGTSSNNTIRIPEQARFCRKLDQRLSSISMQNCMASPLTLTGHSSSEGQPILRTRFGQLDGIIPTGKVMLIGGVHGDELSSVSIVFEWMQFLRDNHKGEFIWDVVPVMNPDGFFAAEATRTNANGVDLNRNMPTSDWDGAALDYWRKRAQSSPRKFPGASPGSEPETRWLVQEIDRFQPDMIVTVHAPYNLIDYDAPSRKNAPRRFGRVKGGLLGTYPGSLGNYAGVKRGIPVVTIELPSANKAMSQVQAHDMWADMLVWLGKTIPLENQRFMKNRRYAKLSDSSAF